MVIEYRAYTMKPGNLGKFYQAQVERGFDGVMAPLMRDCLIGYFATVSGPNEQLVHLYAMDDLEDWRKRYADIYVLPEMQPYFEMVRPLMLKQENKFLTPAPIDAISPLYGAGRDWRPGGTTLADLQRVPNLLVEEQTISLVPGGLPKYWAAYEEHALAAISPLETNWIGCFFILIGGLHQVFNFWYFDDMADRQRRHNAVAMNPRWQAFLDQIRPLVVGRDSKLMTPAPVSDMSPLFAGVAPV
ncbi:MAG: hypothetical protein GKS02_06825 [Alphaproteobacteria bacterium]|nr:hypothetical protein [Alphaproteobacteria bacterium]